MNRKEEILAAFALKAFELEGAEVDCKDQAHAAHMRISLYTLGKKFRKELERTGEGGKLVAAFDALTFTAKGGILSAKLKEKTPGLSALLDFLGEEGTTELEGEETARAAEASLQRLQGLLGEGVEEQSATRATPYYTREE